MDISIVSNLLLSVLSFILAGISVWIAISTLNQNNKMLEEATRPSLSLIILSNGCVEFYVKNCGSSDAIIEKVTHNMVFSNTGGYYPFKDCCGAVIAPGQYLHYVEEYRNFCESNEDVVSFCIVYRSNAGKKYVLDQKYSIVALRNQTHMETTITEKNAAVVQAKSIQRIANLQRIL